MSIVLKSGNLNLLEPSGPVQACNGIALPLKKMVIGVANGRAISTLNIMKITVETCSSVIIYKLIVIVLLLVILQNEDL